MAASVMVLAISSSILALQKGLQSIDNARSTTLAAQIMQSEIEILRLLNWTQIGTLQAAQASPTTPKAVDLSSSITTGTSTALDQTLTSIAAKFVCTRLITDITGREMKRITIQVSWTGLDSRPRSLSYETRYAKDGLSDYYYTSH